MKTRRSVSLLLVLGLLLPSCAAEKTVLSPREGDVSNLTREILTSQEGSHSLDMKERALQEYERFVLSSWEGPVMTRCIEKRSGCPGEAMADAAHRLADLYMDMESPADHSKSRALYEKILTLYPQRPRNDFILYQLARGYADERQRDKVKTLLERLVKEYPGSSLAQESYFRLGEALYDEDQLESAAQDYRMVLRKQDLYFYEKALYKLGWTLFQSKDYNGAADSFLTFLDRKGFQVTHGGQVGELGTLTASDLNTIWEVANTTILVFDYMGGAGVVRDYFKTRGDQRYETYVYRRLGDLYMEMGRFKEAADIFEAFVNSNPLHEDAPYFQAQAIEAYTRGNFLDLAHEARITLVENFREGGTWFKANAGESKRKARALVAQHREQVRESMYELVLYSHTKAQSSKHKEDYGTALSWGNRFLTTFPDDARKLQVNFLLAEGLFSTAEYLPAVEAYTRLAYPESTDETCDATCLALRKEAGYGALLSLERLVKRDGKVRQDDPLAGKWVEESERFIHAFPGDPRIPGVLLNETEVLYELHQFESAREKIRLLLAKKDVDEKTRYLAQRRIAESFLEENAYLKTEEEIRKAIAMIPKGREKDRPVLEKALASALYKQAEELRNQGKLPDAARVFTRVGVEVPDTSTAPVALYDAASVYTQLGDRDKAIQAYRNLSQKYPDSPYVETSLVHWAELLRDQGSYLESARTFEKATSSSGRDQTAKESASFLAGLMYEKAGDWESAQKAFSRYRNTFPDGNRVVEAVFRAGKAREHLPDPGGAVDYFREVVSLQQKMRNPAPEEITLAAQAQFAIAEEKKVRFEEVRLASPLEKNLGKKKALLKEALEGYTATAKYKISEMTTASAYRMGEILEHFRDALLTSERPRDLKPEQLEQYDFLLEEQAYPFEEKAIAAYESNVRRAQETGTFDRWVQESYGRLAALLPARYQRTEQGERWTGELNADSLDQVEIPSLLNSAGIYFREKGDFPKAEEFYQRAIRLDPGYPEVLFNLGVLHEIYLNNPEAALENYRSYLKAAGLRKESPLSPGGEGKVVNGDTPGQTGEKENLLRQVELWITALEKKIGGHNEQGQTP